MFKIRRDWLWWALEYAERAKRCRLMAFENIGTTLEIMYLRDSQVLDSLAFKAAYREEIRV